MINISRYLLLLCLFFLQSGFSYYISFQVLGMLVLVILVFYHGCSFKISIVGICTVFLFISFTLYTGMFSPLVINPKSTNTFLTVMALLVYSLTIFALPLLYIKHNIKLLLFIRRLSSNLIIVLFFMLIISELNIIPFLNREALAIHNIGLIDNFTSIEDIELNIYLNQFNPKVDLFYGEPSFLAIVIFASIGSFVIANEGLKTFAVQPFSVTKFTHFFNLSILIPVLGIVILVYIQSLSSIICAVATLFYCFFSKIIYRKINYTNFIFLSILIIFVTAISWEYVSYRLFSADQGFQSVSFIQRFDFLTEMSAIDWIIGLKHSSMLPEFGIHNGVTFLIAISGFGGIVYFLYLLRRVYISGTIIGLSTYAVFLILAIFLQNGGIFSPGKIVLISLVLLPLAAVRSAKKDVLRGISSGAVY